MVDDHQPSRDELVATFAKHGWEVAQATNGTLAIDLARTHIPNVVFTELVLADMGGHQLARSIRNLLDRPTLIIAITRIVDDHIHAQARRGGFDDVFVKPVQMAPLFRRVAMGTGRNPRLDPSG